MCGSKMRIRTPEWSSGGGKEGQGVGGHLAAGRAPLVGVVGDHPAQLVVGSVGPSRPADQPQRYADEEALEDGLAPRGVVETSGVRPERGCDQARVVGAQRVVEQVDGAVADRSSRWPQAEQHRPPLVGVAEAVEVVHLGAQRVTRQAAAERHAAAARVRRPRPGSAPGSGEVPGVRPISLAAAGKRVLIRVGSASISAHHSARSFSFMRPPPRVGAGRRGSRAGTRGSARRRPGRHGTGGAARARRARCSRSRRGCRARRRSRPRRSPSSRCSWTPATMSSTCTLASSGPARRMVSAMPRGSLHTTWPRSRVTRSSSGSSRRRRSSSTPSRVSTNVPGLGLDGAHDAAAGGDVEDPPHPVAQASPGPVLVDAVRQGARPERDRLGAEVGGHVDRPEQVVDPAARVAVGVHQRRVVLARAVEDVAGSGLDHDRRARARRAGGRPGRPGAARSAAKGSR